MVTDSRAACLDAHASAGAMRRRGRFGHSAYNPATLTMQPQWVEDPR